MQPASFALPDPALCGFQSSALLLRDALLLKLGLPGFGGAGGGSDSDLDAVIDAEWQSAKENAKATRTIFAQRSLKPEEALREWHRSRDSLGSADAIERLVLNACRRLNLPLSPVRGSQWGVAGEGQGAGQDVGQQSAAIWELDLTRLEDNRQALNERLRNHDHGGKLRLSFRSPAREGSQLLSRSGRTGCRSGGGRPPPRERGLAALR